MKMFAERGGWTVPHVDIKLGLEIRWPNILLIILNIKQAGAPCGVSCLFMSKNIF